MDNTNPCPTCHAQLDPGTPHTFCARTKEPKARELATRIAAMEANFDLLHRLTVDKREKDSLASKMDNLFGGGIDLATRVEALEQWQALYEDADATHGGRSALARIEAMETDTYGLDGRFVRIDTFNGWAGDLFKRLEALERAPVIPPGDWTPEKIEAFNALTPEQVQELGRANSSETPNSSTPAASALPMPERPETLDWKIIGNVTSLELAEKFKVEREAERLYALSLESRLAEASRFAWPVTDLNTEEECVVVLRMFGNPQASRVADVLEGITASRDALKAKLADREEQLDRLASQHDALNDTIYQGHNRDTSKCIGCGCTMMDPHQLIAAERTDRDALRAKLDEAEKRLEDVENSLSIRTRQLTESRGETRHLRAKFDAMSSGIANEQRSRHGLERRVTELEANLDGVREALSDAISTVGGARLSCVGDHYIHSPQVRLDQVDRWRSALAAAENTNTGTVGADCVTAQVGTQPKQPRHTTSQSSRPLTEPDAVGDSSRHGSEPAVPVPSSATAFEMTPEQRRKLLDSSLTGTDEDLMQFVRSLVRSELRKAREGQS